MAKRKPADIWDIENEELAEQKAEQRAYGVEDTEELEYAERIQHERQAAALYRPVTKQLADRRKSLVPKPSKAFNAFSRTVFAKGAIPTKMKHLIAVAVAHVTQCPYCIRNQTNAAMKSGATPKEIMEAIWVTAEMRAGAAYEHSILALHRMVHGQKKRQRKS